MGWYLCKETDRSATDENLFLVGERIEISDLLVIKLLYRQFEIKGDRISALAPKDLYKISGGQELLAINQKKGLRLIKIIRLRTSGE